ncbi:hypothetical protein EBT25_07565 [bacterium]|nr:hypothetical protein [bacterium]
MLSADLLQHIAIARLILGGSIAILITLVYAMDFRKNSPPGRLYQHRLIVWAVAIGIAWALGVATILLPGHTLLWGNQGDETFQIAFMERVIAGEPFSDFFYEGLSVFYPPLYFWIFGTLGRLFNWDGISAAQWGTMITYALLPLISVFFAKWCRWPENEQKSALFLSVATLLCMNTEALLLKPYEVAAALLSVLWLWGFYKLLQSPTHRLRIILGMTGGIIFLLYYFWFVLLIPAMIGLIIWLRPTGSSSKENALSFVSIGIIVTLISSPFLLPYLHDLITLGQENFQAMYFYHTDINIYAPWMAFTPAGILIIASLFSFFRKEELTSAQKASLALGGSILLWHIVQMTVLATGGKSVMLSKPFLFLGTVTLFLPAVEWIAEMVEKKQVTHPKTVQRMLAAGILLTAPLFPQGIFLEDIKIQDQLEQNKIKKTSAFVAENIRVFIPDYKERTWLMSGLQDINGILPLTHYLAWNPHFSHPAAHWQTRLNNIKSISELSSATKVTQAFDERGIDALLLFKARDEEGNTYYPFFYEEDTWPNGAESRELRFEEEVISLQDWEVAHEDNEWKILLRRR